MPELPEVEITTRKLKPLIVGKRILNFGERKILDVERRGKAILIHLSGDKILGFHQRMSGKLLVVRRGWKDKHTRRVFRLSDGRDLVFHDVRKFGVVWYGSPEKVFSDQYFRTLGKDALTVKLQGLKELLKPHPLPPLLPKERGKRNTYSLSLRRRGRAAQGEVKKGKIKSFLLNQKNIAGVGNIMADEILWHARIHPKREVRSLREWEVRSLWKSLKFILNRSIKMGGSTMRDWLRPDSTSGGYFEKRFVYGREGEKCFRCKFIIFRKKIAGRSSYFCAKCQKI